MVKITSLHVYYDRLFPCTFSIFLCNFWNFTIYFALLIFEPYGINLLPNPLVYQKFLHCWWSCHNLDIKWCQLSKAAEHKWPIKWKMVCFYFVIESFKYRLLLTLLIIIWTGIKRKNLEFVYLRIWSVMNLPLLLILTDPNGWRVPILVKSSKI